MADTRLQAVDTLIAQNHFADACQSLKQLQLEDDTPEVWYRLIKARVLEIKWATSLHGSERTTTMNKLLREDYLGLVATLCANYLAHFGQTDSLAQVIRRVHELAVRSLGDQGCKHQPMRGFDAQQFVKRLAPLATFFQAIDTIDF